VDRDALLSKLVEEALQDIDDPAVRLSAVVRKAVRIARLRNDLENVLRFQFELESGTEEGMGDRLFAEVSGVVDEKAFRTLKVTLGAEFLQRRSARTFDPTRNEWQGGDKALANSLPEMENLVEMWSRALVTLGSAAGTKSREMTKADADSLLARVQLDLRRQQYLQIIERIRTRVHTFLSRTEAELAFAKTHADLFERNRRFVEERLRTIAPDALRQFTAAYQRTATHGDEEARSQAALSCRRILKSLADAVYPASGMAVTGVDGVVRIMTDDKYISRLWQFVSERAAGKTRALLLSQVNDIGRRIEALNDLTSKGVHGTVSETELTQCFCQIVCTMGDILRLLETSV
jgi:hypothetical protein